tara:strand:- start:357 stop:1196 length:840 start_codon:yes stop_codon:yes gene_type:complete
MNSNFIRLEAAKTKLTGTSMYISAIDDAPLDADGTANTTYGNITITGISTNFTGQLADGNVIQLCSDATMFNTYDSINVILLNRQYKFSMQFETILEEYEVVSRASTTSMVVKPYTSFEEEKQKAIERAIEVYIRSYKNAAGDYESLRFTTAYKKNLVNSETNDYVVNLEQISHFHINASSAQNMDVHFADTGSSTRSLIVHNCFEYLNYILQPYTQIEQQRIFYDYENTDLTVAQPIFYSNYSYPKNSEFIKERKRKSSELDAAEKRIHLKNTNSNKQ